MQRVGVVLKVWCGKVQLASARALYIFSAWWVQLFWLTGHMTTLGEFYTYFNDVML